MKKVYLVASSHHMYDPRIYFKEAKSLAKKYDVTIMMPREKGVKLRDDDNISFEFVGLQVGNRLIRYLNSTLFLFKLLFTDAEIIHLHDLELYWLAMPLSVIRNYKIIIDVHENYPLDAKVRKWINNFSKNAIAKVLEFYLSFFSLWCDSIITVTNEIADFFKRLNKKVYLIENYPNLNINLRERNVPQNEVNIIYVGVVSSNRKILSLVEFVSNYPEIGGIKLNADIIGDFPNASYKNRVFDEGREAIEEGRLYISGKRIEHRKCLKMISRSHIGISLFEKQPANKYTISTKIFEYMSYGLIPIVSAMPPNVQRFKNTSGVKLVPWESGRIELFKCMEDIINNLEQYQKWSYENQRLVKNKFLWKSCEERLFSIYRGLE